MKKHLVILASVLAVSGPALAISNPPGAPGDSCGAAEYQHLVGAHRSALRDLRFDQPVRIIGPNDRVTQDYRPDRLNFDLDRDRRVQRIYCG